MPTWEELAAIKAHPNMTVLKFGRGWDMKYDVGAIKESVNLVELAGGLRRVSGGEFAGPCPRCGGKDRFHATSTWWFCRQCHEKRGDAIEYVVWRDGVTFGEACKALGASRRVGTQAIVPKQVAILDRGPPSDVWQARAREFVTYAQSELWKDAKALEYLRDRGVADDRIPGGLAYLQGRGLSDDTIREAGLGWHDKGRGDDPSRWGVRGGSVALDRGLVIPGEMGGNLWYVKIRRPEGDPKYRAVKGSRKAGVIYGLDAVKGGWDVILVEGELNALILKQELAGVSGVVSVGDAGNLPGEAALSVLGRIARWWALYDPDKAGEQGAEKLKAISARVRVLDWPFDGDANDAHLQGHDLAAAIVPQIGPRGDRLAWLRYWIDALDGQALAAGADESIPALRVWLVLEQLLSILV